MDTQQKYVYECGLRCVFLYLHGGFYQANLTTKRVVSTLLHARKEQTLLPRVNYNVFDPLQSVHILRFWFDVLGHIEISTIKHLFVPADAIYLNFPGIDAPLVRHDLFHQALY